MVIPYDSHRTWTIKQHQLCWPSVDQVSLITGGTEHWARGVQVLQGQRDPQVAPCGLAKSNKKCRVSMGFVPKMTMFDNGGSNFQWLDNLSVIKRRQWATASRFESSCDQSAVQPVHNAMLDRMISANGEPLSAKAGLMWVCLAKLCKIHQLVWSGTWFSERSEPAKKPRRARCTCHVVFLVLEAPDLGASSACSQAVSFGAAWKIKERMNWGLVVHWWFTGKRWNWHNFTQNWKLEMESFNTWKPDCNQSAVATMSIMSCRFLWHLALLAVLRSVIITCGMDSTARFHDSVCLVVSMFFFKMPQQKIVITTVLAPTFQTVNEPPSTNNPSSSAKPNSKTSKEATMPRKHQLQITRSKRQLPPKPAAVSLLTFTDSDH